MPNTRLFELRIRFKDWGRDGVGPQFLVRSALPRFASLSGDVFS